MIFFVFELLIVLFIFRSIINCWLELFPYFKYQIRVLPDQSTQSPRTKNRQNEISNDGQIKMSFYVIPYGHCVGDH